MKTIKLTSRKDILEVLKKKDIKIYSWGQELIPKVELTEGVKYNIAIIKIKDISPSGKNYVTMQEIHDYAKTKGYITPPAEVALLLRAELGDKDIEKMDLWYVLTAHEPIIDSGGLPWLISANRFDGGRCLDADCGGPGGGWSGRGGVAFLEPQVSTKSSDTVNSFEPTSFELPDTLTINNIIYKRQ